MSTPTRSPGALGVAAGLLAYMVWGLSPLFWKQLGEVPPVELTGWRIFFTFVLLSCLLLAWGKKTEVQTVLSNRRTRFALVASGLLLAVNWGTYVWAVSDGRIVESALGYFINPLFSVFLGVVLLGERLRNVQWLAVALAVFGVVWLTIDLGTLPWVALTLASSFGLYGLVRKVVPVDPFVGLAVEAGVLVIPAIALLFVGASVGMGAGDGRLLWGPGTTALLVFTGVFTAIPLVLFAFAAARVSLSLVGLLQYVNPTMQFFIGWQIYNEPFDRGQFIGYCIIWVGLIIFAADGLRNANKVRQTGA